MSDLETERMVRGLLRSGLDKHQVLQRVVEALFGKQATTTDLLAAILTRETHAMWEETQNVDHGVTLQPSFGPQHSVPVQMAPPSTLHIFKATWRTR